MRRFRLIRTWLFVAAFSSSTVAPAFGSSPLVQGVLPARVDDTPARSAASQDRDVEAWDINGDGYPDMVRVKKERPDPTGAAADVAFDFDADGKPDFFRSEGVKQSAQPSP